MDGIETVAGAVLGMASSILALLCALACFVAALSGPGSVKGSSDRRTHTRHREEGDAA